VIQPNTRTYRLLGPDGRPYRSPIRGTLGGHRRSRVYGRLDCPAALRAIEGGGYVRDRVFFADEEAANASGYRPCAACLPERYARWRAGQVKGGAGIAARLARVDWPGVASDLDRHGWSLLEKVLTPGECSSVAGLYDDGSRFRNRVVMARHGFGRGEYSYFAYPLPELVAELRTGLYPHLVSTANRWNEAMRKDARFPGAHAEFLARCHGAGQSLPTPLLLRYAVDDYNCLHQDQYGEHVFPLQVAILLSEPELDFTGGEFVLTEQRPRMQSRAEVVPLHRGDAVVFAVNERPVPGRHGSHRVRMRHGVSRLRSGRRATLGLIFHDAK
jgi:uncharacterized protein